MKHLMFIIVLLALTSCTNHSRTYYIQVYNFDEAKNNVQLDKPGTTETSSSSPTLKVPLL